MWCSYGKQKIQNNHVFPTKSTGSLGHARNKMQTTERRFPRGQVPEPELQFGAVEDKQTKKRQLEIVSCFRSDALQRHA